MSLHLLATYRADPGRYDEMLGSPQQPRPHWQALAQQLDQPAEMQRRMAFVERRLQENGVTFNVYADPRGSDRPWMLDPIPLMIDAQEWQQIEAAVTQRAQVLNAALIDLYGPQQLLREGTVPSALVFGHHGFLPPCRDQKLPGGVMLHHYAADLARSPDGRWWVIADHTQSPTGAGYALENRLIVSRLFPQLFQEQKVQHLAAFFRTWQESLAHWAPVDPGEQAHIVLLTSGPYDETYFEHAYLARYLGFALVESQDVTVRGDTVYLKTLTGLKRVHVILRRPDDLDCDPLEFHGHSALGIAGLMHAVRARRVLVANALGSGLMGSNAFMGFLPGVAQRLLQQDLLMPSVATWWCGEQPALAHVLAHLDHLVIKPAYPTQGMAPVFGRDLHGAERREWVEKIRNRPSAYVAQEMVQLSQAPTWDRGSHAQLVPRATSLRVYAVATPQGYVLMPGALARVASSAHMPWMSMQRGGSSKDTWVLAADTVNTFSLLKTHIGANDLVRSGSNLSSRVVENLFWLGRHAERHDCCARLLRVALTRLSDNDAPDAIAVENLLRLCQHMQWFAEEPSATPAFGNGSASASQQDRLLWLIHSKVARHMRDLLWCATQVRERLSLDHWRALTRLQHELQTLAPPTPTPQHTAGTHSHALSPSLSLSQALDWLDRVLLVSASLNGFVSNNMTRDKGWHFLMLGRHIERFGFCARNIAGFLQLPQLADNGDLEWLLELADSIITYRSRYSRTPELLPALDLIVADPTNPHGVLHQIDRLQEHLQALALGTGPNTEPKGEWSNVGDDLQIQHLQTHLCSLPTQALVGLPAQAAHQDSSVQIWITALLRCCQMAATLSDHLANRHFSHVGDRNQQTLAS